MLEKDFYVEVYYNGEWLDEGIFITWMSDNGQWFELEHDEGAIFQHIKREHIKPLLYRRK